MKQLTKLGLMERIEQLEQMAESEKNYSDYCKLQAEIWKLQSKLNSLGSAEANA